MSMPAASPAGTGRGRLCIFFFPYAVFNVPAASVEANGDGEIRTHDPLLARQVLSQLSYTPNFNSYSFLNGSGSHLPSHAVPSIVLSAAQALTFVFGMCTGVPPGRIATRILQAIP